ncbi:MAG: transcription-repair coupling factor, partial [Succinivibrio sp.]
MHLKDLIKNGVNTVFSSQEKSIGNLNSTGITGTVAAIYEQNEGPVLVICADSYDALTLKSNLFALLPKTCIEYFSDWETLPYDTLSPHEDIVSSRIRLLAALPHMEDGIVITTVQALMPRIAPVDYIASHSFAIRVGDRRNISKMKSDLTEHGYLLVEQVLSPGEFAVRGSIVDLFPMGCNSPYRIDFFDDEVDTIRIFDVDSQRSLEKINEISLLPAHEFPLDEKSISQFRSNYRDCFIG